MLTRCRGWVGRYRRALRRAAVLRRETARIGLSSTKRLIAAKVIPVVLPAITVAFPCNSLRSSLLQNVLSAQHDQVHGMHKHGLVVLIKVGGAELD